MFGCVAYAKMVDVQRGKLDAKYIECLFLGYCEGINAYRLICLQIKIIIKNRDLVFIEDDMSNGKTLEMLPNRRKEGPTVVVVDESSKSSSYIIHIYI